MPKKQARIKVWFIDYGADEEHDYSHAVGSEETEWADFESEENYKFDFRRGYSTCSGTIDVVKGISADAKIECGHKPDELIIDGTVFRHKVISPTDDPQDVYPVICNTKTGTEYRLTSIALAD
jgi:hypothetical protein